MTPSDALLARLEGIAGASTVRFDTVQRSTFAIDDCKPAVVVCPTSTAQAAEIVALAGHERLSLIPWGQGTQMHLGKAPTRYDMALSLAGLNRILDYDEANFTVTAEAGTPLREMYKASLPKRQFLPLGFPGSMTSLGGTLTTNTSGVKRLRYGGVRDLLLGVRVALPDGAHVHFGGRVVKNVAGYDMNKLFIGSLGTFGVVLETTYRLAALPEDDRILAAVFPNVSQATQAAAAVQGSQLLPSAATLLSPAAAAACDLEVLLLTVHENQVVLCLNFDGMHEAVERQLHDGQAICEQHGSVSIAQISGEAILTLWEGQEAWRTAPDATAPTRVQIRLGVLPSHIAATIQQISAPQSFCQQGGQWLADYSNGQIFVHLPLDDIERAADGMVSGWLRDLRAQLHNKDGYGVIEYAPAPLRRQLDIWGQSPGYQLLRLYKQHFDPHAVLNPGRYIAGL